MQRNKFRKLPFVVLIVSTFFLLLFYENEKDELVENETGPLSIIGRENIECLSSVDRLKDLNVRLLALDFDQTIVDIHTSGHWRRSPEELSTHVRREMRCLILESMHRGIHVGVVTFSRQEELIGRVLELALPELGSAFIPVRGGDNHQSKKGKQKQLSQFMADIHRAEPTLSSLFPPSVLLIDDDRRNVEIAQTKMYLAIRFDPENPKVLYEEISGLRRPS